MHKTRSGVDSVHPIYREKNAPCAQGCRFLYFPQHDAPTAGKGAIEPALSIVYRLSCSWYTSRFIVACCILGEDGENHWAGKRLTCGNKKIITHSRRQVGRQNTTPTLGRKPLRCNNLSSRFFRTKTMLGPRMLHKPWLRNTRVLNILKVNSNHTHSDKPMATVIETIVVNTQGTPCCRWARRSKQEIWTLTHERHEVLDQKTKVEAT